MSNQAKFILVVEDDVVLRAVIVRALTASGYLVLIAGSFREATAQLAVTPALMILDINLPDATGWDVAAWLERHIGQVPVILMSGGTPDIKRLARLHPLAFLPKPFAIDDLLDIVAAQVALSGKFGA